jgi:uncharacterized protein (DUF305 family)
MRTLGKGVAVMAVAGVLAAGGTHVFTGGWSVLASSHGLGHDHAATGETDHGEHGGHGGQGAASGPEAPSSRAYAEANDRMHAGMAIAFTGDADVDFARGMIPHHQGAIDMARVVLEHGSDPELRRLAEAIIAAQEGEIAFLEAWLEVRGE